jgi:type VI secretion system protein ImpC
MQEVQHASPHTTAEQGTEFERLLHKEFRPRTDRAKAEIENAVQTLAQQALRETAVISDDVISTVKAIIAELDRKLSDQLNLLMHEEKFQRLESAWRGLKYLVDNSETDEKLKIKVMNISKADLLKTLRKWKATTWDQSPLFKQLYEQEYGQLGGAPYGCIIGDYHFDHTAPDVEVLTQMSQIAAAAHAPFIAGAAPSLMGMDSWQELANPRDLTKIFEAPDYAAWNALRDSEDAKYLGLAMPRFLGRLPYGPTNPAADIDFEEQTNGGDHSRYTWVNSAYAMGANINRSFKQYGWGSWIRGFEAGGRVDDLPVHTFPGDDGNVDVKCPTEVAVYDRREAELAKNGLMPLVHRKNTSVAAFIGAQSVQKPRNYEDVSAKANAELSARLPYLFAVCRFAHYLKCMVRDKVGSFKEQSSMQRYLSNWIQGYVVANPDNVDDEVKSKKPLSAAEVIVTTIEGDPGYYSAKFSLRPHYQLEGVKVSLSLVSKLPSGKQA